MFTFITSVVQKIRGRRSASLRRAEFQVDLCVKITPPAPSSASPILSLDIRPQSSIRSECAEVSESCDVVEDEVLVEELREMSASDDEDSLKQIESCETHADHLSPAMSYDHEAMDEYALWLSASDLFEGETSVGEADLIVLKVPEKNDNYVIDFAQDLSALDAVLAEDKDVVAVGVKSSILYSVEVVESEGIHVAEEQTVEVMNDGTLNSPDAYNIDFLLILAAMDAFKSRADTQDVFVVDSKALRTMSVVEAKDIYAAEEQVCEVMCDDELTDSNSDGAYWPACSHEEARH